MKLDPDFLRQHYASLSDESLLELDRSELVDVAQQIFDEEIKQRGLDSPPAPPSYAISHSSEPAEEEYEFDNRPAGADGTPAWLEEGAEVYADNAYIGRPPAEHATAGRDALEEAGIPCHLELYEIPREESAQPNPTHRWRLMVPGELSQRAANVLDRDVFNPEFEEDWKTHLHSLSDKDLRATSPQDAFLGLYDRIARLNKAYHEELVRRRLK